MSTTELPIDIEGMSRELEEANDEEIKEIPNTVFQTLSARPPEREPEVPDLLDMKGFLRDDTDEDERPGTTALMENREKDKRKDEELLSRLPSDE